MDLKDQIVSVVYQSPGGLGPVQIVEALATQYDVQTNSKQVLQVITKNPKLFVEEAGRFKSPSGLPSKKKK